MKNKYELKRYVRSVFNMLYESSYKTSQEEQLIPDNNPSNDNQNMVMESGEKQDENIG